MTAISKTRPTLDLGIKTVVNIDKKMQYLMEYILKRDQWKC